MSMRGVLLGTASGYILVAVRLVTGLAGFRLACSALDDQQLGLYSLLWSVQGLLIMCDLGGGVAVQRLAGALGDRQDEEAVRQRQAALSSVLALTTGIALVVSLVGLGLWGCGQQAGWFATEVSTSLSIFAGLTLATFPLGVFKEVLRGQERLWIVNVVDTLTALGGLLALWLMVRAGGGLVGFVTVSGATALCGALIVTGVCVGQRAWQPRWRMVTLTTLRSLASFGLAGNATAILNALFRLDQAIMGALVGLTAVGHYAPGVRLQTLFNQATGQFLAPLVPVAAAADAATDPVVRLARLRSLLVRTHRWGMMISFTVAMPLLCAPDPFLRLLTGDVVVNPMMRLCALALLSHAFFVRVLSDAPKMMMTMSGGHWQITVITALELGLALGGGAIALWWWGHPAAMAMAYLFATALMSGAITLPLVYRRLHMGLYAVLREVFFPVALACALPALVAGVWWGLLGRDTLGHAALGCVLMGLAIVPGAWRQGLDQAQRRTISERIRRCLGRTTSLKGH